MTCAVERLLGRVSVAASTVGDGRNSFTALKLKEIEELERQMHDAAKTEKEGRAWIAGRFDPAFHRRNYLPALASGLRRPQYAEGSEMVQAAARLSAALQALDGREPGNRLPT